MPQASVNLFAVVVAAAASMLLGGLWYSPILFGKTWMKLARITSAKGAIRGYIMGFFSALIMSYVLAHFIDYTQATTISAGLATGFWLWLGFIATVSLGTILWESKPFMLYVLNNAYNLLALILMAVIHVAMG